MQEGWLVHDIKTVGIVSGNIDCDYVLIVVQIFGYVDQNFPVIQGTVAEQISLKDPDIRREQIENALQFVGLKDYVETLADGMDTEVKNETKKVNTKEYGVSGISVMMGKPKEDILKILQGPKRISLIEEMVKFDPTVGASDSLI